MGVDRQKKDRDWNVADEDGNLIGGIDWQPCVLAVLMDIRRELRLIRQYSAVWNCPNFRRIPFEMQEMATDSRRRNRLARLKAARKRAATIAARKANGR